MKLKNLLTCAFDIRQSESKVYHTAEGDATEEKLVFLTLDEDTTLDGFTADFAVCSRAVAAKLATCKDDAEAVAFLAECTVEVNDQGENTQLAIKMPNSAKALRSGLHF